MTLAERHMLAKIKIRLAKTLLHELHAFVGNKISSGPVKTELLKKIEHVSLVLYKR